MSDIRINALATTATTPASDDYLALDGSANGTRKILATNIANNVTDVILGASGPSVKSTLSARAPRQGLVFDGTAIANNANVPAFGSADFTFAAWVYQPTLAAAYLCSSVAGADDAFMYLTGSGTFQWWSNSVARATSSAGAVPAGKWTLLTATRTGGTTTLYANGVSVGSGADTQNITAAIDRIGGRSNSTNILNGSLVPLIYNRALSSSEVVALYEAGAPAGSDYNTASNTALNTATFANSNIYPFGTFSGASTTGFSAASNGVSLQAAYANASITFIKGAKYRLTYTLVVNSGTAPSVVLGNPGVSGYSAITPLTAGTNSVELECTISGTSAQGFGFLLNAAAGNFVISSVSLVPIGLLLAPDAYQGGGGTSWYDTSGNSATITLPASGVSWNVPTSGKIASALNITDTTDSSSKDTGCLILEGGLGVEKKATFGGGINGTTTNDSAAAGCVGEYVSSTIAAGSAISLTTGTSANLTSISLTAGDWDVDANVGFVPTSTTNRDRSIAAINATSATLPNGEDQGVVVFGSTVDANARIWTVRAPTTRVSISSTTTYYLVVRGDFTVSTLTAYGSIRARRVR